MINLLLFPIIIAIPFRNYSSVLQGEYHGTAIVDTVSAC